MSKFDAAIQQCRKDKWGQVPHLNEIANYLDSGDAALLKKIKPNKQGWSNTTPFREALSPPGKTSAEDIRCLQVLARLEEYAELGIWLRRGLADKPPAKEEYMGEVLAAFGDAKPKLNELAKDILNHVDHCVVSNGKPTSVARWLAKLSDADLKYVIQEGYDDDDLLRALLATDPQRVTKLADDFLYQPGWRGSAKELQTHLCGLFLELRPQEYEKKIAEIFAKEKSAENRFHVGMHLTEFNAKKYQEDTKKLAEECLRPENAENVGGHTIAKWLMEKYGEQSVPVISEYVKAPGGRWELSHVFEDAVKILKAKGRPIVVAGMENPHGDVKFEALERVIEFKAKANDEKIEEAIRAGFKLTDGSDVVKFLGAAAKWDFPRVSEDVWGVLGHKSKPAREAASRLLGQQMGDAVVPRGIEMLSEKKAANRMSAVALLTCAGTDAAVAALEKHLDEETDEDIRDRILMALESAWEKRGKKITKKDIEARRERVADKLKTPPAKWLKIDSLPPLKYTDGKKVEPETVKYLLYRQSRAKEVQPDVEAKPLFAMIDRGGSGDFAAAVLEGFLASKQDASDRFALTIAGMLGDDRLVPPLIKNIKTWCEKSRGKLGEYATRALALIGSDVALSAVDSLAIRYRSKFKNIGKTAAEAFGEAAERLGVTPDELGDRVVPWLGFEPNQPRILEIKGRQFELRIGSDCKLQFIDLEKEKPVKSLPSSASKELKAEMKDLGANLREIVKGQTARLENLMVRQQRWSTERWEELFLVHVVLAPFAVRLVWGAYEKSGKLKQLFRPLEDRSLTNEQDETVQLPAGCTIGIVHPLEMSADQIKAWQTHLADYEVAPPFAQLERPVVKPEKDQEKLKFHKGAEDTELNAMTFRSRAERLGWTRGSVTDGGGISEYMKTFPAGDVDVFLELDNFYIGIGMDEEVKLGRLYFTKGKSVQIGSYVYDQPSKDSDERLVEFGKVPPIVFSESMGDLQKIVGDKGKEEEEE